MARFIIRRGFDCTARIWRAMDLHPRIPELSKTKTLHKSWRRCWGNTDGRLVALQTGLPAGSFRNEVEIWRLQSITLAGVQWRRGRNESDAMKTLSSGSAPLFGWLGKKFFNVQYENIVIGFECRRHNFFHYKVQGGCGETVNGKFGEQAGLPYSRCRCHEASYNGVNSNFGRPLKERSIKEINRLTSSYNRGRKYRICLNP